MWFNENEIKASTRLGGTQTRSAVFTNVPPTSTLAGRTLSPTNLGPHIPSEPSRTLNDALGEGKPLMRLFLKSSTLALAFWLSSALFLSAAEITATWIGLVDGDWNDPANWSTGTVPNNSAADTYDVVWEFHPVTIHLETAVTIRNFRFASGGMVTGAVSLTIEGRLTWLAGTFAGTGATFLDDESVM